jgi:hypothetical protein
MTRRTWEENIKIYCMKIRVSSGFILIIIDEW